LSAGSLHGASYVLETQMGRPPWEGNQGGLERNSPELSGGHGERRLEPVQPTGETATGHCG